MNEDREIDEGWKEREKMREDGEQFTWERVAWFHPSEELQSHRDMRGESEQMSAWEGVFLREGGGEAKGE